MLGFLKQRRLRRELDTGRAIRSPPPGGPRTFVHEPEQFHVVYENKVQPDAGGARSYAYESLALAVHTAIGPNVAVRNQFYATAPGAYLKDTSVPVAGIPTQTGYVDHAPLFNPDGQGGPIEAGYPAAAAYNAVTERASAQRINDPSPLGIRKGL